MSRIVLGSGTVHHIGKPFTVCIREAAKALSHINRFTGHVGAYSVAQHSALVARVLPKELRLSGLLHDLPEAYLGDVSAPLKRIIGRQYAELGQFYHDQIDWQFKVDTRNRIIKQADLRMLVTEARAFGMDTSTFPDIEPYHPAQAPVIAMSPQQAEREFMRIFREETGASDA